MKQTYTLLLLAVVVFLLPVAAAAQQAPVQKSQTYDYVEKMPAYTDGSQAMYTYLGSSIPYSKSQPEGRVVVSFVVDKNGAVKDVKLVKGLEKTLDEACVQAVRNMPGKWEPGIKQGEPVAVRYTIPLNFTHK
ncbi:energy transducer TonB [Pontibacter sp. H259]|uniref:energy transducer TonB n=1 Tax=Pontibacter sp. H259 TaxID=3133421 RepID=UPI0030BFB68B